MEKSKNDKAIRVKCYQLEFPGESYTGILVLYMRNYDKKI